MTEQQKPQNWWMTIPGLLTAIAGIITAITGLIIALNQTGIFNRAPSNESVQQVGVNNYSPNDKANTENSAAHSNNSSTTINSNQYPRTWDVGAEFQLSDAKYKILNAQLAQRNTENLSLTLHVRMTNVGRYPANFWDESFRLLIDDVPKAPISQLNKLVNGESAEEGDVLFIIPSNTKSVTLRIRQGDESTDMPMSLTH